jgi:hypothetical protein
MKFLAFFGLLALTLSCKDQSIDRQYFNGQIELGKDQTVKLSSAGEASLTINGIQDNRCPPNAFCIRAGELIVDLTATQNGNAVPLSLCTGPDCQTLQKGKLTKTTIAVGNRIWTIELVNTQKDNGKVNLKVQIQ